MIVSGGQTLRRPFLKQLPASYMEPLNFSFILEGNGFGENVSFGLCDDSNNSLINYNLRSGIVYDYSGRNAGTYQSGINKFEYFFTGNSWQKINDRLVSLGDPYSNYSGNPFRKFYISNNSSSPIDFDLTINGFSPPTEFTQLGTSNLTTLSGFLNQSGLSANPGQEILYEVFNISVPSQYGTVNYFDQNGLGQISYTISGAIYSFNDSIPVTFDTYWGEFTYNLGITGNAGGGVIGGGEAGTYLNVYGVDNLVNYNGTLNFNLDYYSNVETPVSIELQVITGNTTAQLSGYATGTSSFAGNVVGSGYLQSMSATGIADLQAPINTGFNTQYDVLDRYLNITQSMVSQDLFYFTGQYRHAGVFRDDSLLNYYLVTGYYAGPKTELIGGQYRTYNTIHVDHNFIPSDLGVYFFSGAAISDSTISSVSFDWRASPSDPWVEYPNDVGLRPEITNGLGTGYTVDPYVQLITGQGYMSFTKDISIFGYGVGRVGNNSTFISATGITGSINYTGSPTNGINYSSYPYDKPVVFPTSLGGVLYQLYEESREGYVDYNGNIVPAIGVADPNSFTWGYASGPTTLTLDAKDGYTTRFLSYASITGQNSTGGIVSRGYTGTAVGFILNGPVATIPGPTFSGTRNTSFFTFTGGYGLNPISGASYGRSEMRQGFSYSYDAVGMPGTYPDVVYTIVDTNFRASVTLPLTGYQPIYLDILQPKGFTNKGTYINFLDGEMNYSNSGQIFSGYAEISASGVVGNFNLLEGLDETSNQINYIANGWISGNSLIRPMPEIFPDDSACRYLTVEYLNSNPSSLASAILRISGGSVLEEIYITGNSDGIRY